MNNNQHYGRQDHQISPFVSDIQNYHHRQAEIDVLHVINDIVEEVQQQSKQNAFLSKNILKYSNIKIMNNMNEVNSLFWSLGFFNNSSQKQEDQPKPLLIDSMLPISADIDPQNQYKKQLSTKRSNFLQDSSVRLKIKERQNYADSKQKYTKLEMGQVAEQDGYTKELRRLQQQKNQKLQTEKKLTQKKQKLRLQKLKDKKKEQKFSYDYNGQVIELKLQNKANLVSKLVNGATRKQTNINKQAINDPNPTVLEGMNPSKKNSKKFQQIMAVAATKRRDDVEFSNLKSLTDHFKTTYGVKYTYEGKTLQQKKRVITTMEIKKSLSQRKISKQQYKKIRDLNANNRQEAQSNLKGSIVKNNEIKSQRVNSQMKFSQNMIIKARETIHVSNTNQKEKLLQKVAVNQQHKIQQTIQTQKAETLGLKVGNIDNFNMEYMKTGGSLPVSTSRQFYTQRSNNQLPKITHTTLYSKMKPKGRERIKQANQILRDLRKRFQEKLRV